MRTIDTWRDPYGEGWSTCRLKQIDIKPGLTVLVGCNGAGKTTLLRNIKDELEKDKVPFAEFDNLNDGGSKSVSSMMFNENYEMVAHIMSSSEGENIGNNLGLWAQGLRNFIVNGKYKSGRKEDRLMKAFASINKDDEDIRKELELLRNHKERWLLLDATDSGLSIDNVIEFKDLFNLIIDEGKKFDKEVYIIISANEYELARNEQCFDVNAGKYITFKDYDDYREFILKSRDKKDKRYNK